MGKNKKGGAKKKTGVDGGRRGEPMVADADLSKAGGGGAGSDAAGTDPSGCRGPGAYAGEPVVPGADLSKAGGGDAGSDAADIDPSKTGRGPGADAAIQQEQPKGSGGGGRGRRARARASRRLRKAQEEPPAPDPAMEAGAGEMQQEDLAPEASQGGGGVRRKRDGDVGGSDRSVRHKSSSSEEDGSDSPVLGTPPSEISASGSASSPTKVPSKEEFTIYRKKRIDDEHKSTRVKKDYIKPIGPQIVKYDRSASESSPAKGESSPSSSSSFTSYSHVLMSGDSGTSSKGFKEQESAQGGAQKPTDEEQESAQGGARKPTDEEISSDFIKFLNEYIAPGEKNPYYPAQLTAMKEREGCFKLTVEFKHILKKDKHLALNLLRRNHLCRPCVVQFMAGKNFAPLSDLNQKVTVDMIDMPKSFQPLKDILSNKKSLVTWIKNILRLDNESVEVLTELAQALLTGFLLEIRKQHDEGKSWDGDYTINDMALVDGCFCLITKQPHDYSELKSNNSGDWVRQSTKKKNPFDMARVEDVKTLEKVFSNALLGDEKDVSVKCPLFYESLKKDLSSITPAQVKDAKFWIYLLNHPALKPPASRYTLIILIRSLLCENISDLDREVREFLEAKTRGAWRRTSKDTVVLKDVYNYEPDEKKKQKSSEEPFKDSYAGLVTFNRHYLQHANRVVKNANLQELEIFFASKINYLPALLKGLIHLDAFTGDYYEAWRVYGSQQVEFENAPTAKRTFSLW